MKLILVLKFFSKMSDLPYAESPALNTFCTRLVRQTHPPSQWLDDPLSQGHILVPTICAGLPANLQLASGHPPLDSSWRP